MTQKSAVSLAPTEWLEPSRDDESLNRLIGRIYDAALDPTLWPGVLRTVGDFVDGKTVFVSHEHARTRGDARGGMADEPRDIRLCWTNANFDAPASLPSVDAAQRESALAPRVGERSLRASIEPQGWVDAANAVLEKSDAICTPIAVFGSKGSRMVDESMRRRMAAVVPHVRRAIAIGEAIRLKRAEAATFADALDGLAAGTFLVDADGRLIHVNAAGRAILAADDVLGAIAGRLVARDGRANQALREILATGASTRTSGIALVLIAAGGERYVAHVLPLTAGARRRAGIGYAATSGVFVRKAALDGAASDTLAEACHLTPTELRVLLAIVDIGGVPEVAAALGVAVSTIKTHLGRVFQKTGAIRQADLVKLVAGFSSPMIH